MTEHQHAAERLREAAGVLRACADDAEAEVEAILRDHPEDSAIWSGPTATAFYDVTGDARRRLGTAAKDLRDYAAALDARADDLDSNTTGGSA